MLPEIASVTEFKRNVSSVLDQLSQANRPVLVMEPGRVSAQIIDVENDETLTQRADILDRMAQL